MAETTVPSPVDDRPARGASGFYVLALICLLTLAAYSGTFSASFHFDDYHQIVSNPNIRSLANVPGFFVSGHASSYVPGLKGFRPVNITSFAFNYAVSGYETWSYHLFNILLHVLNSFLVYVITSMICGASGADRNKARPLALFVSLAFALHPIQTEAVTYISGRSALLSCFFCLLGFYSFLRYRTAGQGRPAFALAAIACFGLGLLSKETAVVLLGIIFVYDLLFTAPGRGPAKLFRTTLDYLPFLAILAFYLAARNSVQGSVTGRETAYGTWGYLLSEAKALLTYVRLLFIPAGQNADYALPLTRSLDAEAGLSLLGIAAAIFLLFRLGRTKPMAAFFGLWFFVAWAPESTFVPITDIAVEYRMYMPSVGFIAFMAAAAYETIRLPSVKKWAAVAVLAALAVLSFNRNAVWATESSLWRDVVKKSPYSARARHNLGLALIQQERYREAAKELETALAVEPAYGQRDSVYNNLGLCLMKTGDRKGALRLFEQVVRMNPEHQEAYYYMGLAYYGLGRYRESAEAFQKAISVNPAYAEAHSDLAQTYRMLGRPGDALRESEEALKYNPRDFAVNYNLAVAYYDSGMFGRAMEQARMALALAGDEVEKKGAQSLMSNIRQSGGISQAGGG